ncbi:hypothetical protein Rm378p009 [Rhodothermus phage RM378]|uniref:hypothetical protein n=1 Tax=Rhodothermus phage RM378 TaxID=148943 RepID=UPI000018F61B|nr:hypothetical protein Rm378p009 [Rhodothermus phage RM378]
MTPKKYRKEILSAIQQYYRFQKKYPVNIDAGDKHVTIILDIGENATAKEIIKETPRMFKELIEFFIKKTRTIYSGFSVDSKINDKYQQAIEKFKEKINKEKETVQKIQKIFNTTHKYPDLVYRKNEMHIFFNDQSLFEFFPALFDISVIGASSLYPVKNAALSAILFHETVFTNIGTALHGSFYVRPMIEENIRLTKAHAYFNMQYNRLHELIKNIEHFLSLINPGHPDIPKIAFLYSSGIRGAFELRNLIEHSKNNQDERVIEMFDEIGRALDIINLDMVERYRVLKQIVRGE